MALSNTISLDFFVVRYAPEDLQVSDSDPIITSKNPISSMEVELVFEPAEVTSIYISGSHMDLTVVGCSKEETQCEIFEEKKADSVKNEDKDYAYRIK